MKAADHRITPPAVSAGLRPLRTSTDKNGISQAFPHEDFEFVGATGEDVRREPHAAAVLRS